jgi:hypothetical protein
LIESAVCKTSKICFFKDMNSHLYTKGNDIILREKILA